jgi:hypothetical protein
MLRPIVMVHGVARTISHQGADYGFCTSSSFYRAGQFSVHVGGECQCADCIALGLSTGAGLSSSF